MSCGAAHTNTEPLHDLVHEPWDQLSHGSSTTLSTAAPYLDKRAWPSSSAIKSSISSSAAGLRCQVVIGCVMRDGKLQTTPLLGGAGACVGSANWVAIVEL